MAIELVEFTPDCLGDVEALLLPVWGREWGKEFADGFFRWRFLDRPAWDAKIAYDGAKPVAFLDSFLRKRQIGSALVEVRETADWFCLPEYRPLVGIMLMRAMMAREQPMLVVGGNENTQGILPRLGWHTLMPLTNYTLPLGAGAALKGGANFLRLSTRLVPPTLADLLPIHTNVGRRFTPPSESCSFAALQAGDQVPEICSESGVGDFSLVLDTDEAAWMRTAPESAGQFLWLVFFENDLPVGLSVSRIYRHDSFRSARLLHVKSSAPTLARYEWIVGETSRECARRGAHWIGGRFNSPLMDEALMELGFRKSQRITKAFWWDTEGRLPAGELHLDMHCGDEGLAPLPA